MTLKASPKSHCSDKIALRLCSRLLIEPDKCLLVFAIRYPDVPSVPSWAGGTSAVWLLLFLLLHITDILEDLYKMDDIVPIRWPQIANTEAIEEVRLPRE